MEERFGIVPLQSEGRRRYLVWSRTNPKSTHLAGESLGRVSNQQTHQTNACARTKGGERKTSAPSPSASDREGQQVVASEWRGESRTIKIDERGGRRGFVLGPSFLQGKKGNASNGGVSFRHHIQPRKLVSLGK